MALHDRPKANKDIYGKFSGVVTDYDLTDTARQWEGWGTALKPAFEPICLARKPLSEDTVAANVLRWGTGALNIDGCRVGIDDNERATIDARSGAGFGTVHLEFAGRNQGEKFKSHAAGRWPANILHDGSDEVVSAFPSSGKSSGGGGVKKSIGLPGEMRAGHEYPGDVGYGDGGSAARFFYCAKANARERVDPKKTGHREGAGHPTVKPIALMRWLVRLVTPPGGTTLDPFAGTGTTGEAAIREGCQVVLIERETDYRLDIAERMRRMTDVPAAAPVRTSGMSDVSHDKHAPRGLFEPVPAAPSPTITKGLFG